MKKGEGDEPTRNQREKKGGKGISQNGYKDQLCDMMKAQKSRTE